MKIRDNLNSLENYIKMINFMGNSIQECEEEINELLEDEKNGIQRNMNPNAYIVEATKRHIFLYQENILLAYYSAGFPINDFKKEFLQTLNAMKNSWEPQGGYLSMLNMLSIAIMLDLNKEKLELFNIFKQRCESGNFKLNDFLLDYLFRQSNCGVSVYPEFMIAKPYSVLKEVIELADIDKIKSVQKLKTYLQKNWFNALRRQDLIQETHKSPHGTHCGYWSFESGALVKILGLDDSILKEQQYYPYDLVHYKEV